MMKSIKTMTELNGWTSCRRDLPSLIYRKGRLFFMTTTDTRTRKPGSTYRPPKDQAVRDRANAYQRQYRRDHPDRTRAWREAYILRKAARIMEGGESA